MLKPDGELESSTVVANNTMNRDRGLTGVNSYHRALGLDPYDVLRARLRERGRASWLDLCCGEANALIEAAGRLGTDGLGSAVTIVGVDLVGRLRPGPICPGLSLVTASIATWDPQPEQRFDLVTCVHGLHYIGDKLGLLTRAMRWLTPDGVLIADFDRHPDASPATRRVVRTLRQAGADYDPRTHRVTCRGPLDPSFPAHYLGADDAAGPSYTGQPGVASHYRWL